MKSLDMTLGLASQALATQRFDVVYRGLGRPTHLRTVRGPTPMASPTGTKACPYFAFHSRASLKASLISRGGIF